MIISALVPQEDDGVLRQGDHLVGACVGHGGVVHSLVHCEAGSSGVSGSVRVNYSQAVGAERSAVRTCLSEED